MTLVVAATVPMAAALVEYLSEPDVPSFEAQACALPAELLERIQRGYYGPRSGQISIVPRTPMYMASGAGGWSHSGPWDYLQRIPLVFYGPGIVPARGEAENPATMADVAPTIASLVNGSAGEVQGTSLPGLKRNHKRTIPRLVVTVVWDGGGWNVLNHWGDAWPNLRSMMEGGISFTNTTDGSSPSVTPAVHTTLGTGDYPERAGVTDVPVMGEDRQVADAFLNGESSRYMQVPAFAETWDEGWNNKAKIGMVGYEPWHLGMIGQGAERDGGDADDAVWLDRETNEWITNEDHYTLPDAIVQTTGLQHDLETTDAADGKLDGAWRDNEILDAPDRIEEVPGFMDFQTRAMENLIEAEGYGSDHISDLLFTNYKQIDRNGHYYNMAAPEVEDSLVEADAMLAELEAFLDEQVGHGRWVMVVTADHGQQPDEAAIDSYGIAPKEIAADIDEEFGTIVQSVWPTQIFLDDAAMQAEGVTTPEVARWLYNYTIDDNATSSLDYGRFDGGDRVLDMAIPAELLPGLRCSGLRGTPEGSR
jgi:arylsulfatase A-like enzyme